MLIFFAFDPCHSYDDAIYQVDPLFSISFEIEAVIYLIYCLSIFQTAFYQLFDGVYTFLLEFA